MKRKERKILQRVYDLFDGTGGSWPSLRELKRELIREGGDDLDTIRIVQHLPARLMHPLCGPSGYHALHDELVLTAEGIKLCAGSREVLDHLVIAVKWVARRAERADLSSGREKYGISFTLQQLVEAVSLSQETDGHAIGKLLALMEAEGWVDCGDGPRSGLPTRLLAPPGSSPL